MAVEWLSARFSHSSQLWFRWTGKLLETATSNLQTVESYINDMPEIEKIIEKEFDKRKYVLATRKIYKAKLLELFDFYDQFDPKDKFLLGF